MNIDIMIHVEPFAFRKCVFGILSGESRHKMAYIAEEKIKDPAEMNCPKLYGQHKKESQGRKY